MRVVGRRKVSRRPYFNFGPGGCLGPGTNLVIVLWDTGWVEGAQEQDIHISCAGPRRDFRTEQSSRARARLLPKIPQGRLSSFSLVFVDVVVATAVIAAAVGGHVCASTVGVHGRYRLVARSPTTLENVSAPLSDAPLHSWWGTAGGVPLVSPPPPPTLRRHPPHLVLDTTARSHSRAFSHLLCERGGSPGITVGRSHAERERARRSTVGGKGSDVIELHGGDTSSSTSCSSSSIPLAEEGGRRLHGLRWWCAARKRRLVSFSSSYLSWCLFASILCIFFFFFFIFFFMARGFGRWSCWSLTLVYVFNYRTYSSSLEFHGAEMRRQRAWIFDEDNRPSWNLWRLFLLYFSFSTSTLGISCVRSLRWTHVASQYLALRIPRSLLSGSKFEQMLNHTYIYVFNYQTELIEIFMSIKAGVYKTKVNTKRNNKVYEVHSCIFS